MSIKKYKPEQIVTLLRQIEVAIANGKTCASPNSHPPQNTLAASAAQGGSKHLLMQRWGIQTRLPCRSR